MSGGDIAVITGGASGLGFATAQALAAEGMHVVILDLPSSDGEARAALIGGSARFLAADVTDAEGLEAAFGRISGGEIRLLVTCAGVATPGRVLGRNGPMALSDFDRVLRINVSGSLNAIRLAAARMVDNEPRDGERGVIVTTASAAAFEGQIGQAAYSASKGAVHSMTLPIAREFAPYGIRVNSIAPGIFRTPMLEALPGPARERLAEDIPFPSRTGRPEEFARLVLGLRDNGYLNGATIRLDGALRMAAR